MTENWRYRMVRSPKGEYRRIPASRLRCPDQAGAGADERAGNQCSRRAPPPSACARPSNINGDADTLRIETRRDRLESSASHRAQGAPRTAGERSRVGTRDRPDGAAFAVITTNLRAILRKNGVPHSERATVTEHFDVAPPRRLRPAPMSPRSSKTLCT